MCVWVLFTLFFSICPQPRSVPITVGRLSQSQRKKGQSTKSFAARDRKKKIAAHPKVKLVPNINVECVYVCTHKQNRRQRRSCAQPKSTGSMSNNASSAWRRRAERRTAQQHQLVHKHTHTHTTCGVLARSKVCNIFTIAGALCFEFRARSRYVVNPGAAVADVCVRMFYTSVQY